MFSFVESVDDVKESKSEGDRGANISVRVRSSRLSLVARDVLTSRATQKRNMKCPFGKPLINRALSIRKLTCHYRGYEHGPLNTYSWVLYQYTMTTIHNQKLKYLDNQLFRSPIEQTTGYNATQFGKPMDRCCTTSIYNDTVPPYHNTQNFAYSRLGLPFGDTLGFFRFKPVSNFIL